MRFRFSMTCALGLAAALVAFDASHSYVQAQTPADSVARRRAAARRAAARRAAAARARSERSISTSGKEVPVEPMVQARVDTVYQVRSDTVYRMQTDTVTVARVDTVSMAPAPVFPTVRMGGFYWGLGGGLSAPRQQLNTIFEPGFNVTGMLGWDPYRMPLGIRLDAEYDQFSERSDFAGLASNPQIFGVNLGGKLRIPFGSESGARAAIYALGGGSWFHHKNLLYAPAGTTCCGGVQGQADIDTWQDDFGWNAGGGLSFGFGPSNVFLESRWMGVKSNRSFVPIIIGVTF